MWLQYAVERCLSWVVRLVLGVAYIGLHSRDMVARAAGHLAELSESSGSVVYRVSTAHRAYVFK